MQTFNSFQEVFNANAGTGLLSTIGIFNAPFDKYSVKGETVVDVFNDKANSDPILPFTLSFPVEPRFQFE